MLVMSRRQGETILIGDEIEIVIAHIGRSRVKVGIRAPREMAVIAHEMKVVREENVAAAARPGCPPGPLALRSLVAALQPGSSRNPDPRR
jgi:carbon storage regulator